MKWRQIMKKKSELKKEIKKANTRNAKNARNGKRN